jgi:hypothetical protein
MKTTGNEMNAKLPTPDCLFDATEWTQAQAAAIIAYELTENYTQADNLRTAVMMMPKAMGSNDFVAAAVSVGVNPGTARNRFSEVRRQQKEDGEI